MHIDTTDRARRALDIQAHLAPHCGTLDYHPWNRLVPNMLLTDGAKALADLAGAYWLMDAIASHQCAVSRYIERREPDWERLRGLQVWRLWRKPTPSYPDAARLECKADWHGEDSAHDPNPLVIRQRIPYTDFPFDQFTLYVGRLSVREGYWPLVILLRSEY